MGINLSYLFSNRYPLDFVSEQVTTLPKKSDLAISSVGWPKIVYYFSGSAAMTLDRGENYRIAPRTTVVFSGPHGQRYLASDSETPVQLHALIISFEKRKGTLGNAGSSGWDVELAQYLADAFSENHHLATAGSSLLWNLAVRIRNVCQSNHPMRDELVCELAQLFALHVAEFAGIHPGCKLPEPAAWVAEECNTIVATPSQRWDRLERAATIGISPSTLDRVYRECLGDSYAGYVDWVRTERAKSLLQSSRLAISQVAKELHFESASTFGRAFKAATGMTPGEYRQGYHCSSVTWSGAKKENRRRQSAERGISELKSWELLQLPAVFKVATPCLLACLEGEIEITIGRERFHLGKMDRAIPIAQGAKVECRLASQRAMGLLLRGTPQKGAHPAIAGRKPYRPRYHAAWSFLQLREWFTEPPASLHAELSIRTHLRVLWWEAFGQACNGDASQPAPQNEGYNHRLLIGHAKEFIAKHFARDLTLGEIAWAVGVSEEHLARVFRTETGDTVMAYRLRRRIYRAQSMLVRTGKPISEVAEACGFDSVGYFYRAFKKQIGCTPAAFRQKGIGALP